MAASFDYKKRLGAGYFGEVWHAIDTGLGCEIALKCIPKEKIINTKNFYQEAQTLKTAEHPNIIAVKETGQLHDGQIYVVMEYLRNGSLEDEAQGAYIKLSRAKKLMIDVLRGLSHSHKQGIVHRDIKPANIMIGDTNEGKLSDFGLAIPDITTLNISYLKKYQYLLHLAPEVSKFEEYTSLSDIYACGATFYRLVNGDNYLPRIPVNDARSLALQGKFPDRSKYRKFIPRNVRKIVNRALSVNPAERFQTADEMRHAIEQVNIRVEWEESLISNGMLWRGQDDTFSYEVRFTEGKGKLWSIETRRGKNTDKLRRITILCHKDIAKGKANSTVSRILQNFVTGKK